MVSLAAGQRRQLKELASAGKAAENAARLNTETVLLVNHTSLAEIPTSSAPEAAALRRIVEVQALRGLSAH
jgi:hypothetical protein